MAGILHLPAPRLPVAVTAGDDLLRHDLAWSLRMREALLTERVPQIQERIDELIRVVAEEVGS